MQSFECPQCSATLFFDSLVCKSCRTVVSYDPVRADLVGNATPCANRDAISCNWQTGGDEAGHCEACRLTTLVPDMGSPGNDALWAQSESAKRWMLANLAAWGWFGADDAGPRPEFHFLAEQTGTGAENVAMGHKNGLVTINIMEADPVVRIARREQFNEPYRTMIGHFRHEIAHYILFHRLYNQPGFIRQFRAIMGDERDDYGAAISSYYENGPIDDWQQSFVSGYASSHPHEDWAETFAHLLHLTDIADTFIAVGFSSIDVADKNFLPYQAVDSEHLLSFATELTIGLNQLNRSMGLSDIYPFVLTPSIRKKISFVHKWVSSGPAGRLDLKPNSPRQNENDSI